ncbi:unnamed protein product [Effrenium voratum]|nr:unnamed protein product [Effrenium voratum]
MALAPLLGLLEGVCEVTAQVADREVSQQAQSAPGYERWIDQALGDSAGPLWLPCIREQSLRSCSVSANISGIMQQFLALCQEQQPRPEELRSPALRREAAEEPEPAKPAPADEVLSATQAPSSTRLASMEESRDSKTDSRSSSAGPASLPLPQASPVTRCGQEQRQSELTSPGAAAGSAAQAPSGKRVREGAEDFASPISERIAQAPSPIRALRLGPRPPFSPGAHYREEASRGADAPEASPSEEPALESASAADRPFRSGLAAAVFAQDSTIEPTEEIHLPRPVAAQSEALFAAPPDSPEKKQRPRTRPSPEPDLRQAPPHASPERKELTPIKVADRIMMFEKIISPSVRCFTGSAMSSSSRMGKAPSMRGSACTDRSSGRPVDGSSLFTPVQAWARPDVKPKELFRSNSDLALSRSNSDLAKPRCKGEKGRGKGELPPPKPRPGKNLPRAKPTGPASACPGPAATNPAQAVARSILREREQQENIRPEASERLASNVKRETAVKALPPRAEHGSAPAHDPQERQERQERQAEPKKAAAPPNVPVFRDPALDFRSMELPLKNPEDSYDISEYGDSEGEDASERDRMRQKKTVPKWCETYLVDMQKQGDIDPDTIFGKVPRCVMDDVFPESLYQQVGKKRPGRRRGSSADWRRDRLTRSEIRSYKHRMGQQRSWETLGTAARAPALCEV